MTGVTFTFEIDELAARDQLNALVGRMENLGGFYKNVGEHLVNANKANFDKETSPDGVPWMPLMPSTIRRRENAGQVPIKILTATKALKGSIRAQVETSGVRVGAGGKAAAYAAIHQLGGVIDRPARTGKLFRREGASVGAYSITMPVRPYLGVGPDDEAVILEIAEEWLSGE